MIPWTDDIKKTGKLSIYVGSLAGTWAHVFREALREYNALCAGHKLGITLSESKAAPTEDGGANVSVEIADGAISRIYGKTDLSEPFDGKRLHGRTLLISREGADILEKVFIYLPSQPQVNTPQGLRAVGTGVMKVIAAHELVHACGLENGDHTSDDLFQGNPRVDFGNTPAQDKILIGTGPKKMPPIYMSGSTANKLKDAWSR